MEKKQIIFISSASSFLGKELVRFYNKQNYLIISYSQYLLPLKKKNYVRFREIESLKFFLKNINEIKFLFLNNGLISNNKFDILITSHLKQTSNFLKIFQNIKINRIILFNSADENGQNRLPIKETDFFSPQNNYGLIKSLSTIAVKQYCIEKKINYTFFKLFLVVGKKQNLPRLFPLIKEHIDNKRTFLLNSPNHIKNILYVDDFIFIVNKVLLQKKSINEIYNLGSNNNISMINLCKKIKRHNDKFIFKKSSNLKVKKQIPDISKLKKLIGNYTFINIKKIISLII